MYVLYPFIACLYIASSIGPYTPNYSLMIAVFSPLKFAMTHACACPSHVCITQLIDSIKDFCL